MSGRNLRRTKNQAKTQATTAEELKRLRESQINFPYRAGDPRYHYCTAQEHGTKKNCYCNPHCLYGLGERKEGIWGARCQLLASVGPDPSTQVRGFKQEVTKDYKGKKGAAADAKKRKVKKEPPPVKEEDNEALLWDESMLTKVPAGLENLGATCYLNSLLQCLFFNRKFREGVYRFRPPPRESQDVAAMAHILKELQYVFGHLQLGRKAEYNPRKFADLLGLDSSEQQDPQEFNRLFMDKIEECFKVLGDGSLNSLINDMFRGQQRYVTTCCSCKNQSTRLEAFCELEVNIDKDIDKTKLAEGGVSKTKQTPSVTDCIEAYLMPEELTGDNQYFCSNCATKQDATRAIQLAKLPPVLCIQLIRYRFDRNTMERKKLKNSVYLEESLDLGSFTSDETASGPAVRLGSQYDLVAVLYHKGSQATGGHYVAEVKDTENDRWWLFDDETVKPSRGDHSGEGTTEKEKEKGGASGLAPVAGGGGGSDGVVDLSGELEAAIVSPEENGDGESEKDDEENKATLNGTAGKRKRGRNDGDGGKKSSQPKGSADAYMLIYKARGFSHPPSSALCPPQDVEESVKEANDSLKKEVDEYKQKKRKLEESIRLRKEAYEELFHGNVPPGAHGVEPHVWIETKYLKQWITGERIKADTASQKGASGEGSKSGGSKGKEVLDVTGADGDDDPAVVAALKASLETAGGGSSSPVRVPPNRAVEVVDDDEGQDQGPSSKAKVAANGGKAAGRAMKVAEVFAEPLNMAKYQCSHGKLDPNKTPYLKVVRKAVFDRIVSDCKEPPTVVFDGDSLQPPTNKLPYYCQACVEEFQSNQSRWFDDKETHDVIYNALVATDGTDWNTPDDDEVYYLLSKKWEAAFRKQHEKASKTLAAPQTQGAGEKFLKSPPMRGEEEDKSEHAVDPLVNSLLTCEHEKYRGSQNRSVRRVDADLWAKIKAAFPEAIEYKIGTEPCAACKAQTASDADLKKKQKEERESLSNHIKSLAKRKTFYPGNFKKRLEKSKDATVFYLIEKEWVEEFRHYFKDFDSDPPPPLTNSSLLCEHLRLLLHPEVDQLVSRLTPKEGESGATLAAWLSNELKPIEIVDGETWEDVKAFYGDSWGKCHEITLTLKPTEILACPDRRNAGCRGRENDRGRGRGRRGEEEEEAELEKEEEEDEEEEDEEEEEEDDDEEGDDAEVLVEAFYDPPVCEDCKNRRVQEREAKMKVFTGSSLKISLLKKEEEIPASYEQLAARRRPTRAARKEQVTVHMVSSETHIGLLKLKALEAAEAAMDAESIILFFEGQRLDDNSKLLADYGIRADSALYGKILKKEEDETYDENIWEYACKDGPPGTSINYRPEQGFKGTILSQGTWKSASSFKSMMPPPPPRVRQIVEVEAGEDRDDSVVTVEGSTISARLPLPGIQVTDIDYNVELEEPEMELDLSTPPSSPSRKKRRPDEDAFDEAVRYSMEGVMVNDEESEGDMEEDAMDDEDEEEEMMAVADMSSAGAAGLVKGVV